MNTAFIDKLSLIYEDVTPWGKNSATVKTPEGFVVVHNAGKHGIKKSEHFDEISTQENGLMIVVRDNKYGIINARAQTIIKIRNWEVKITPSGIILAMSIKEITAYNNAGAKIYSVSKDGYIGIIKTPNEEDTLFVREKPLGIERILSLGGVEILKSSKEGTGFIACDKYIIETSIIKKVEDNVDAIYTQEFDSNYTVYDWMGNKESAFDNQRFVIRYEWVDEEHSPHQKLDCNGKRANTSIRPMYAIISSRNDKDIRLGEIWYKQGDRIGKSYIDLLDYHSASVMRTDYDKK